jgi:putative colanic acid biosynthesis glycosyltransferase WcaI
VRLWIVSLNYAPEPTGFAPHAAALAAHMARRGHAVSVVTGFPFAPHWKRWPDYRGVFTSEEVRENVTVRRVSHFVPRRPSSVLQRCAMEMSFCAAAAAVLWPELVRARARPDVVLYVGAQPGLALLTRATAALAGAPYVVNVNDLAAEAATNVGIVKTRAVARLLESIEFAGYAGARGASVLCDGFADALAAHGYPYDRIRVIRSPVDLEAVRPQPREPAFRERLAIPPDAFVVLFAGSMGLKQGLSNVVEAARRQRARGDRQPTIVWLLVGDGETRASLEASAKRLGLDEGVRFAPFQPEDQMARLFAAADVLLLNQVSAVKHSVVPSKLLTYLAAGRPVLAAVNPSSQAAGILREAGGGVLVEPEHAAALLDGVEQMARLGEPARAAMGARNRTYAEQHFDQRKILAQHESLILECLDGTSGGAVVCAGSPEGQTFR